MNAEHQANPVGVGESSLVSSGKAESMGTELPAELVPADAALPNAPKHLRQLFVAWMQIGLSGFGGVLPWAYHYIVEHYRWLSPSEFSELMGICQIFPGPNVINLSVLLGRRFFGWRGALVATAGLLLFPLLIVLLLGLLWQRWGQHPQVVGMLRGIAAVGTGLILATGVKMIFSYRRQLGHLTFAILFFVAIACLRLPMLPTVLVGLVIGWLVLRGKHAAPH